MANRTMQIMKERHTKHLKRDEVSAFTAQMRQKSENSRQSFLNVGRDQISIVENFSIDPIKYVFEKR